MPLQRLTRSMSLDEVQACYQEWLEFFNDVTDFIKGHPEQQPLAHAEVIRVWHAAHDGVMLTDRAALALAHAEIDARPSCPYPEGSDAESIWRALEYAKSIRHHAAVLELSRQLARTSNDRSAHMSSPSAPRAPSSSPNTRGVDGSHPSEGPKQHRTPESGEQPIIRVRRIRPRRIDED
jgi:hypothetical protein